MFEFTSKARMDEQNSGVHGLTGYIINEELPEELNHPSQLLKSTVLIDGQKYFVEAVGDHGLHPRTEFALFVETKEKYGN